MHMYRTYIYQRNYVLLVPSPTSEPWKYDEITAGEFLRRIQVFCSFSRARLEAYCRIVSLILNLVIKLNVYISRVCCEEPFKR